MKKSEMAFVLPVKGFTENKVGLDLHVWSQVTKILEPTLGNTCGRFEPAEVAWKQSIRNPFGIGQYASFPARQRRRGDPSLRIADVVGTGG